MFRRLVEVFGGGLLLASLYALYQCMAFLGQQDYVAAILVAIIGLALMKSGVELARSALC